MTLITGVGYRVKQWGGKWDGTMGVANWCNCHGAVVQGCGSYYVSRTLTSLQRLYEQVQCCQLRSFLTLWLDVQNLRSLETRLLLRL